MGQAANSWSARNKMIDDETKKSLNTMLRDVRLRTKERDERWAEMKVQEQVFERDFRQARQYVIRPILTDFAEELRREGYEVDVQESDGGMTPDWGENPDRIKMTIMADYLCSHPELEFWGHRHSQKVTVSIRRSSRGAADSKPYATYTINEVNDVAVRKECLRFFDTVKDALEPPRRD